MRFESSGPTINKGMNIETLPAPCKNCVYFPLVVLWLARQELELTEKQLIKLEVLLAKFCVPKKEDTHEVAG
jgi:hypothetical protein